MNTSDKIFVAGHRGMVGSAILRRLRADGHGNVLTRDHGELDLADRASVDAFFAAERPDIVFLAAAHVGGILANDSRPADFILENLKIQTNVIDAAWRAGTRKLQFLGSACIYPRLAEQPMKETALLTGPLEPTNEMYAVAKIAGLKLCEALNRQYGFDATAIMPTNLYGPGDNFNLAGSHVMPALIRKFHEAREAGAPSVEVWGTGAVLREFLHVDDMASAAVFLMRTYDEPTFINVGSGEEISVADLARLVADIVGFTGEIVFDAAKPEGMPRKLLDSSRLRALGWQPSIRLADGIGEVYQWYRSHRDEIRG